MWFALPKELFVDRFKYKYTVGLLQLEPINLFGGETKFSAFPASCLEFISMCLATF